MKRSSRWASVTLVSLFLLGAITNVVYGDSSGEATTEEHAAANEHAGSAEHGGSEEHGGGESHGPSPIYRWINFAILVGGLAYVLRKPLSQFFSERSNSIRKSLEDGRKALSAAEEKLHAVEQRLQHFEEEVAAFRTAALKEMEEEHARMRQATAHEAEKLMESVRVQMDVAAKQARLELRLYAAEQAVEMAEKLVTARMDDARQRRLVSQFVEKLGAETRNP